MFFKKTAGTMTALAMTAVILFGGATYHAEEIPTEAVMESSAEETSAQETQPPETQPPETSAPETQPPETQPPETSAPETQPPETPSPATETPVQDNRPQETEARTDSAESKSPEAIYENHSTAIPDNPHEKRVNVNIVDAHETDETETETENGLTAAFEAGETVRLQAEASFSELLSAIGHPIGDARTDVVLRGFGIRRRFDSYEAGSAGRIFRKAAASKGGFCEIAVSFADGSQERLKAEALGSEAENTASVMISRMPEKKSYSVRLDAGEGILSGADETTRTRGEAFGTFEAEATKEGADFCGWYSGRFPSLKRILPTDRVYGDVELTAGYAKYGVVNCRFDLGFIPEGEEESLQYDLPYPVKSDGSYDVDDCPTVKRSGYEFVGWVDENGNDAELKGRTEPGLFTAKWKEREATTEDARIEGLSSLSCPSIAGA